LEKNLFKKWFWFAVIGLALNGFGLSVLGEAIIAKFKGEAWFLLGTLGLILVNSGLCFFGTAVGLRYANRS
tara:strand:- start:238 stop:450 length:213 start_codon:yes stop_codon:yes gene_type:complete